MGKLVDITDTLSWRNFRKRCSVKDLADQKEMNKELLRYIERLEKQIITLQTRLEKMEEQHD